MNVSLATRRLNRLRQVARYIDDHLTEPLLRLDELADIARLSRFHFERVFSDYAGETPMARVRRCRLDLARFKLLSGAGQSVIDLAFDAGYGSAEAFTRAFKGAFGIAPSRIRPLANRHSMRPIRIEYLPPLAIQYIPVAGEVDESMLPFDELRARAILQNIPRAQRKGWSIHLEGDFEHWAGKVQLQAALLSDPLGARIKGLDGGALPCGHYAILEISGGYDTPSRAQLAQRIAMETDWVLEEGPVLRRFENPTFLPARHEKRFLLYLPVRPR